MLLFYLNARQTRASLFRQKETGTVAPNRAAVVSSLPSKNSWDKRAWFLGLFLGNFAGFLTFCASFSTSRCFLEAAFPYNTSGYYVGDLLIVAGVLLGMALGPAVVSGVAQRPNVFWGLLPLSLFFVWDSFAVANANFPLNLDGDVILATLAICWGVSLGPVYLIRPWLRRRRKIVMSTAARAPKSLALRRLAAATMIIPSIALVLLGWYNLNHRTTPRNEASTSLFLGKATETRIPIMTQDKGIFVTAWFNGKKELCRIDTGADTVEWPRKLHLHGNMTGEGGLSCDPTGECIGTQTMVLPHVRIGSYELSVLPTHVVGADIDPLSLSRSSPTDNVVNLGNVAFLQTVLTVDYQNKELTIRPPNYDFMQHRKVGDRIVKMRWTSDLSDKEENSKIYGFPAIWVSLAGASFWCTLDTGWDGPELGLTEDFVKRHPAVGRAKHDLFQFGAMHGSAQVERLHDLKVTIPCSSPTHAAPISLKMDGLVTPTLYGGEGVIGLALMKCYRITIDYQRRRVLLEPYAQDGLGRKQEKMLPKAKQKTL